MDAASRPRPPALLVRMLGALAGLAVGLVVGARACGLPLAGGHAVASCLLKVTQDAGPAVVSAREVARDVAGSATLPALAGSGLGPSAWAVAWLGEGDVVLVASAPDAGGAEELLAEAEAGLAAAVDGRDSSSDAFSLVEASPSEGLASAAVAALADRLASCALAGALVGGLGADAARLARGSLAGRRVRR